MKNVKSLTMILATLTLTSVAAKAAGPGYDCVVRKTGYSSVAGAQLVFKKFVPYTTQDFKLELVAEDENNTVQIRANSRMNVLQIISAEAKTKTMQAFVEADLNTQQIGIFDVINNQQITCKKVATGNPGLVIPLQPRYHSNPGAAY